jgi:hypothetical protein
MLNLKDYYNIDLIFKYYNELPSQPIRYAKYLSREIEILQASLEFIV